MNNEIKVLLIFSMATFLSCIAALSIYFIVLYRKKNLQTTFNMELDKAKIEMQEQFFINVNREIHGNVGQLLGYIKLSLGAITDISKEDEKRIKESQEYVDQIINDLRALAKSLKPNYILFYGLETAIEDEVDQVNNRRAIPATFVTEGEAYPLGTASDLVLFRIFQEGLNNAIKYSKAKQVNISLEYQPRLVTLTITDNGIGFSPEIMLETAGDGLVNIKKRATLIGAEATIDSSPGKGCSIRVTLDPYTELLYTTPESQN